MPGKLYVKTLGCQMNEYDSSKMLDVLRESHGLEPTTDPDQADVLLSTLASSTGRETQRLMTSTNTRTCRCPSPLTD